MMSTKTVRLPSVAFALLLSSSSPSGKFHGSADAFRYRLEGEELLAPEMLCFSGDVPPDHAQHGIGSGVNRGAFALSCPNTRDEVDSYGAIVMDSAGYVEVKLTDVRMRDDGRRRYRGDEEARERRGRRRTSSEDASELIAGPLNTDVDFKHSFLGDSNVFADFGYHRELNRAPRTNEVPSERIQQHHFLQIYLVSLNHFADVATHNQCCYELELTPHHGTDTATDASSGKYKHSLPPECVVSADGVKAIAAANGVVSSHGDYRVNAPLAGADTPTSITSPPMVVNDPQSDQRPVDIVARFEPPTRGRHMVVISNCAAEWGRHPRSNETLIRPLRTVIGGVEIRFVSKFGELPMNLMGIIPFYGVLTACYGILSAAWVARSRRWGHHHQYHHNHHRARGSPGAIGNYTLFGLQRAIRALVFSQAVFCTIAFLYYLHLNGTSVDVEVLYSGTAAALVSWGPWSVLVALVHFATIFACQVVVTLATDGTWLIQHSVRPQTRWALLALCGLWLAFFALYGVLSVGQRRRYFATCAAVWIVFLLLNVRRSLRHLRTLMVGRGCDRIVAAGGALVAKRSMYRRMCAVVAVYPVIFVLSFVWTSYARQDSWTWVGYVLVDIYLFLILVHVTILCIPRPMASQEYVKYAPLETRSNDVDLWEGNVDGENWDEIEGESTLTVS